MANEKVRFQHVSFIMFCGDHETPKPYLTFCYIEDENRPGKTYVGVSICSWTDNPSKEFGRDASKERAETAFRTDMTSDPVLREEAIDVLSFASSEIPMLPTHKSIVVNHGSFRFGFV